MAAPPTTAINHGPARRSTSLKLRAITLLALAVVAASVFIVAPTPVAAARRCYDGADCWCEGVPHGRCVRRTRTGGHCGTADPRRHINICRACTRHEDCWDDWYCPWSGCKGQTGP